MANILTAVRLLLIAPVAWSCAQPQFLPGWVLLSLILLAIATDYFDGKVARALGTASPRGQLFDHGTDFLFVTTSLFAMAYAGYINPFLPLLIVLAFSQYVLDSYFLYRQKQLRMSFLGRWNGILYFLPLLLLACARLPWPVQIGDQLLWTTTVLAQLLLLSTLASIADRALAPLRRHDD